MLIEVITHNLGQRSLAGTCFTNDDDIHRKTYISNILAGMQIGVGIDNGLQLSLHIVKPNQPVQHILANKRPATPFAELRNVTVFLMTMFANHSTSFSNCLITL